MINIAKGSEETTGQNRNALQRIARGYARSLMMKALAEGSSPEDMDRGVDWAVNNFRDFMGSYPGVRREDLEKALEVMRAAIQIEQNSIMLMLPPTGGAVQ